MLVNLGDECPGVIGEQPSEVYAKTCHLTFRRALLVGLALLAERIVWTVEGLWSNVARPSRLKWKI